MEISRREYLVRLAVGYLAAGVLVFDLLLGYQARNFTPMQATTPYRSAIIALDLAQSADRFEGLIGRDRAAPGAATGAKNVQLLRVHTWLDFVFALLWGGLLWAVAAAYTRYSCPSAGLKLLAALAVFSDLAGDVGILLQLDRVPGARPLLTHDASLSAWACCNLAVLIAGSLMLRHRSMGNRPRLMALNGSLLLVATTAWRLSFHLYPAGLVWSYLPLGAGLLLTAYLFLSTPAPAPAAPECPAEAAEDQCPNPDAARFSLGGGGDDAVCFTAGAVGAYFGAGVVHGYLAARRKHPAVVAGISTGALSAAAMQRCYRHLEQGPSPALPEEGQLAEDDTQRWSWLRVYLRNLTERPLQAVWDSLPDMSDFFADMPPIRDSSLPQPDETKARRQRYILIKLGRRLANLPLSVRRVTETVIYFIRTKEQYCHFSCFRFAVRILYLTVRFCAFVCVPVADNFYKTPREDGKEPHFWAAKPLFGWRSFAVASLVTIFVCLFFVWVTARTLLIVLQYDVPKHATELLVTGGLALALLWWLLQAAALQVLTPEYPPRERLWSLAKLAFAWAVLWLTAADLWARWSSAPASGPPPGCAVFSWLQAASVRALPPMIVSASLAAVLALGSFLLQRRKDKDAQLFSWIPGVLLQNLGLSKCIITDFYIVQRIKQLFDPGADERPRNPEKIKTTPMPILLVSAPLQTLQDETGKAAAQLVWPKKGADLATALRAAIAMPGLVEPVVIKGSELHHWLDTTTSVGGEFTRLDLVDGSVIRQNPLPALYRYLARDEKVARKLLPADGKPKPSIHVVFSVPLEPRHLDQGQPQDSPTNIVDIGLLSLKLAKRRDTKQEVRFSQFLSHLEHLVIKTGGPSVLPPSAPPDGPVCALDTLPLSADAIAPEQDINIGPGLSPERGLCLKTIAAGCRQALQVLYAGDIPADPDEIHCSALLELVWEKEAGRIVKAPDPPGLPEVCQACTRKLHGSAQAVPHKMRLSHQQFRQLTGSKPRIIFVASGGVFRGAFQVGVLAALLKAEIQIDLVVGASVGTLMGGALAAAASNPAPEIKARVIKELVCTFLKVDEKVALTAVLKGAVREMGVRGRSIQLSPSDVQRMIHRGSRFDPGFAVAGAPPALLDALSILFVLPYEDTKKLAADFVAGHITSAVMELLQHMRRETLRRLGIEEYLMGVALLQGTARRLLFPDPRACDASRPQPYMDDGDGIALFATTTDLRTWESKMLGDPSLHGGKYDFLEAALSSAAFPAVFQPRRETDVYPGCGDPRVLYSDGGMFDNLPFDSAIRVLTSVQLSLAAETKQKESPEQQLEMACQRLKERHAAPDLVIVGSLDAGPESDASNGPWESILSVRRRAALLNANVKISDFQAASLRVHDQVRRLLRGDWGKLSPKDDAPYLNSIIDAAVLPVFPTDSKHLNPTFAFCRTLGLQEQRIQLTISDGCYRTFEALAEAQKSGPPGRDRDAAEALRVPTEQELLSKSIWALHGWGKLPYIEKRPGSDTCKTGDACPFFTMRRPERGNAANGWAPEQQPKAAFACPFAEAGGIEMAGVYATCCKDKKR